MSFLDRIKACNNAEMGEFVPFTVAGEGLGWVMPETAARLAEGFPGFVRKGDGVALSADLDTADKRTAAVATATDRLAQDGLIRKPTGELYAARNRWSDPPRFLVERTAASFFGLRSYGGHLNGFVRQPDGLHLWIGTRSADKPTYPGELDNMVAGGQPYDLSIEANMAKECAEEAAVPADLAARAIAVGSITYLREEGRRLKPDCMFCFDLEVPADFVPVNTDGEIDRFDLLPAAEVMRLVRETERFKFNSALALIDFFIRHGLLGPDTEPDYETIADRLRTTLPDWADGAAPPLTL